MADIMDRVVRRETHSPRSAAAVVVLVLVAACALWGATELILRGLGAAPLLASPGQILAWLRQVPDAEPRSAIIAGAAVAGAVGLVLCIIALTPGRRAKHRLDVPGTVLVDNAVIASAVAEELRRTLDVTGDDVIVGVGHRAADVTVRMSPGRVLETAEIRSAAQSALAACGLPSLRVRVRVHALPVSKGGMS